VIGLTCMPTKPEPINLGVPVVNFPRANAILARAQALLWVRDWVLYRWKFRSSGNLYFMFSLGRRAIRFESDMKSLQI
jgi:hypothetical protein